MPHGLVRIGVGFVSAEWIFGQGIARGLESSGAGSAAYRVILAKSAAAFELSGIVEGLEHRRVAIDIRYAVFAHVAQD